MKLPHRLKHEPMVDCVFEVRFSSNTPLSNLLPGMLFPHLDGGATIDRLPHAEIPATIRVANPDLKYVPLYQIAWKDKFLVNIGDYNIGISAKMPYPGWSNYKPAILTVLGMMQQIPMITGIERFAYKTTNVFAPDLGKPSDVVKFDVKVGDIDLSGRPFQLRGESQDAAFTIVVQVVSQAQATVPGISPRTGALLDLDVIYQAKPISKDLFLAEADALVTRSHDANKKAFFECITPQVLSKLGPVYE